MSYEKSEVLQTKSSNMPAERKLFGTVDDFDQIYRAGDFSHMSEVVLRHRTERQPFLDFLSSNLDEGNELPARALEVGCGTAIDSLILAERSNCLLCGIDLSREALQVALEASKQFHVKLDLMNADVFNLLFKDALFRLVFSQGVLEHFDDVAPAMEEQLRVLAPAGTLIVSVPQKYTAYTVAKHYRIRRGNWPWGYETQYSYLELRRLGKKFGLVEKSAIGYGYWLHPLEPMWVLRSLNQKFLKIPKLRKSRLLRALSHRYDRIWVALESRVGRYFMRDIAVAFEKK